MKRFLTLAIFCLLGSALIHASPDRAISQSVQVVNPAVGVVSTATLVSLSDSLPVFLVGVNQNCPHMSQGIEAFNALHRASFGRAAVIGLFNGSATEAQSYQRANGIRFRLVADPELGVIDALGITRASEFVVIYKGRILGKFDGFGQGTFEEAVATAARATNRQKWQIPEGMPARPRAGCGF